MPRYSDNDIKSATGVNLQEFLQAQGYELKKADGKSKKLEGYGGLFIFEKGFHHFSEDNKGNAIHFCRQYMNMGFQDAVQALLDFQGIRRDEELNPQSYQKNNSYQKNTSYQKKTSYQKPVSKQKPPQSQNWQGESKPPTQFENATREQFSPPPMPTSYERPQGQVDFPPEAYGIPQDGYGFPAGNQNLPPEAYGMPANEYGFPPDNQNLPPEAYGMPQDNYGFPPDNQNLPPEAYGMPQDGYGYPPDNQNLPPEAYGMPQDGYGFPPDNQNLPPEAYGMPQEQNNAPLEKQAQTQEVKPIAVRDLVTEPFPPETYLNEQGGNQSLSEKNQDEIVFVVPSMKEHDSFKEQQNTKEVQQTHPPPQGFQKKAPIQPKSTEDVPKESMILPPRSDDKSGYKSFLYLTQDRSLDKEIVNDLMKQGKIFEATTQFNE